MAKVPANLSAYAAFMQDQGGSHKSDEDECDQQTTSKMMSSASKKRKGSLKSKKMQQIKRSKVQAIRNREHVANKQLKKSTKKKKAQRKKMQQSPIPTETAVKQEEEDPFTDSESLTEDCVESLPSTSQPFKSQFNLEDYNDSREAARALFALVIKPYSVDKFFSHVWERRPVGLRRLKPQYNDGWFSTEEFDRILHQESLQYTVNINVTSFEDDKRETHNPIGKVYPSTLWQYFKDGCSIQFLNPQSYSQSMWLLTSVLQEQFNSFVGANIYLTPAGTQGFAPHYDDIDAFVLQLEGKKRWRIYKPRDSSERLARTSSENFSVDEIGKPIMDVVLEAGDLLYFPRGFIHQATCMPGTNSMHVTLSTCQKNTWADLFEKMLPVALQTAIGSEPAFRASLPIDYLNYMGIVHSEIEDSRKKAFLDKMSWFMGQIECLLPVEAAVDQMGVDQIHCALPPCLTESENKKSVYSGRKSSFSKDGSIVDEVEITLGSRIKLIRYGAVRLAVEDDGEPTLYFTTNNSRVYKAREVQGMSIHEDDAPGVEYLILNYPNTVCVAELPIEEDNQKVDLCYVLYRQGLLLVDNNDQI